MNRRKFFSTIGLSSLAWPIAKQIKLPGSYHFQPHQIITSGKTRVSFDEFYKYDCKYEKYFMFNLLCPSCRYNGEAMIWTRSSDLEVEPSCVQMIQADGYAYKLACPKCGFNVIFKIDENAKWTEK